MRYDVTIIGGGVIGCAIARELLRYRLKVILLEQECEVGFGTSKSNSGIIHAGHHDDPRTLKGRLERCGNPSASAAKSRTCLKRSRLRSMPLPPG